MWADLRTAVWRPASNAEGSVSESQSLSLITSLEQISVTSERAMLAHNHDHSSLAWSFKVLYSLSGTGTME